MHLSDIAAKDFPLTRKGYDPDAVRAYLVELSESPLLAAAPEAVLAEARVEAERIVTEALVEAERTIAAAHAEAERVGVAAHEQAETYRAGQEALAACRIEEAEHRTADAAARAEQLVRDAEHLARERTTTIIENARVRLQRLLEAEREVHVRLAAAFSSTQAPHDLPLERDDEELLDLAFAEFFSSDIEHDESRAWILSDQPG